MTPDPAPYGADLPRPSTPGPWGTEDRRQGARMVVRADTPPGLTIDVAECGIGDAPAIAAVPEYRDALDAANAEVLALREAAQNVRSMLERHTHDPESLLHFVAQDILALLPAPTEEADR